MPVKEAEHKHWEPTKPEGYWHNGSHFNPDKVDSLVREKWVAYRESKVDVTKLEKNLDVADRTGALTDSGMQKAALKITSFIDLYTPTTPDGYSWWMSLNFRIRDASIAVLLPWGREWRNSGPNDDGLRLDRHIMVMRKGAVSNSELQDLVENISSGIEEMIESAGEETVFESKAMPREEGTVKVDKEGFVYTEKKFDESLLFFSNDWSPIQFKSVPYKGKTWPITKTFEAVGFIVKEAEQNAGGQTSIYEIQNAEKRKFAMVRSTLVKDGKWWNRAAVEGNFVAAVDIYDREAAEMWKQLYTRGAFDKDMWAAFYDFVTRLERR